MDIENKNIEGTGMSKASWFRRKSGSGGLAVLPCVWKKLTVEGSMDRYVFEKMSSTDMETVNV